MSQFQKQPLDVFYRKSCSLQFRNIHRKTPVLESLELQVWRSATLLKETPTKVFSCEYCNIFKNTYFEENLSTIASATPASYC